MQSIRWRKSTYSGDSSNCVEMATASAVIHIRDAKTTEGPYLSFPPSVWARFISYAASPAPQPSRTSL